MHKHRVSLHQLARSVRDAEEESFSDSSSEELREDSRKRGYVQLESDDEDDARYRARRAPLAAPLTGAARFEDSALALQGHRHLFPKKVRQIVAYNENPTAFLKDRTAPPPGMPMNDGTYYREQDNYSGAFRQTWIDDLVTRSTLLREDAFYNFLSILATQLQVDIEETFDIDALDRYVHTTKENLKRQEKDTERTLVTFDIKKKQLALMRDLRWRERVEYDVARLQYARMAPNRKLAEVANALYAEFEFRLQEDEAPPGGVLRARPGVHVIDAFLDDLHLFRLIPIRELQNARPKVLAQTARLANSPDNVAVAARSPLYRRLVKWYEDAPPDGAVLEGSRNMWLFTQPVLLRRFYGLFLLTYFYLNVDVLRASDADAPSPYQTPLRYVHAAYRWVWSRMLDVEESLHTAQDDHLDARVFWGRMHTRLEDAVRLGYLTPAALADIRACRTLDQLWAWLAREDAAGNPNPLKDLKADKGGHFRILERLEANLESTRRVSREKTYYLMIKKNDTENDELKPELRNFAAKLVTGQSTKEGAKINANDNLDTLKSLLNAENRDMIDRLTRDLESPALERLVKSVVPEVIPDRENRAFKEAIEKFEAREDELARSNFPFSFVEEALLHAHLYYVTTNPEARVDREVPRTQLRLDDDRDDRDPLRKEAEESPKSRIQRVYARANRRALAAISGFGGYVPSKEGEPMYAYTIGQNPALLSAVLLAETFAVRLYQTEHAAARLEEYDADILEIEGIIANIATERPALPDRDQIMQRYVAPSKMSVQWRMRPEISGTISVNPTIRALITTTIGRVRSASPTLGSFDIGDLLREENEDFMLAFINCVVAVRNLQQLGNPVAYMGVMTVRNVKQFSQAAFQSMRLFHRQRVIKRGVSPPMYVSKFVRRRSAGLGAFGEADTSSRMPFG